MTERMKKAPSPQTLYLPFTPPYKGGERKAWRNGTGAVPYGTRPWRPCNATSTMTSALVSAASRRKPRGALDSG